MSDPRHRGDAVRLAVGTLTILRVRPPRVVDDVTWRGALLLAPVVGAVLGAIAALAAVVVHAATGSAALAGLAAVASLAVTTRGLHLDGLADTADGLGSGRAPAGALDVMRRGDVGPFGAITLVLVLGAQALSIGALVGLGAAWAVVIAAAAARLLAGWCCRRGVPAAREDGLGAAAAGSVPVGAWWATAAAVALLASAAGAAADGPRGAAAAIAAVIGACAAGAAITARARRRFGGITGDVIGAAVETGATAALVIALVALA